MSGGSAVVFPLSKMNILRDEGGHFMFCRKQLRVLAGTLVHLLGLTSADGTAKGGVLSSILYSVRVVKAQQPKLSALGLGFNQHLRRHLITRLRPPVRQLMSVLVPA